MTKYSKSELETIITFNEADSTAVVSTRSPYLLHRMEKLADQHPGEVSIVVAPDGYREYTFPKKWVRVQRPPRCSEEERRRRSERMIATLEKRRSQKAGNYADEWLDCPPPLTDADCPPPSEYELYDWTVR